MAREWLTRTWLRLKTLGRRRQLDRDLEDEFAFHVAMREERYRSGGLPSREAYLLTQRRFGNTMLLRERCREMWRFASIETLWQDVRYGLRLLVRSPGFTMVATVTLALGIGANTAIFTMINAVMLSSLPVERPNELVLFSDRPSEGAISGSPPGLWWELSSPSYEYFRSHNDVFSGLAAVQYGRFRISARVPGASAVEMARGQLV
ncbi:MAG: permease prefix domain 1-containing protein, partial [Blastocatellia bacterium]